MSVNILVDDVYLGESQEFAEFRVRLDGRSADTVTVDWSTYVYTAVGYRDYTPNYGTLTFLPGETAKTIRVPIINDGTKEGIEAFKLGLYSATNAGIARAEALATIFDNDAAPGKPVVSVNDLVVDEADGTASFVVTLDRPSSGTVSVDYATQDGSARAGADYKAVAGTLRFAAGETAKVVKVALANDTLREGAESFNFVLSKLVGATSLDPVGTAVIAASDRSAVQTPNLSVDDVSVDESTAFAEFRVRLDAPSTETVKTSWGTFASYTADGNADYVTSGGVLTFAPGETIKTVRVPIIDDGAKEGTELFKFGLYGATNAVIVRDAALGTILDSDGPTPPRQTITGSGASDILFGTARADSLFGENGDDVLSGGAGADTLYGGLGNDTFLVDNVRDTVREGAGAGTDTVQSTVGFTLSANVEALLLIGGGAINGAGNELANRIAGNGAANTLDGKAGTDTLSGGAGADTFVFTTALGTANVDHIVDFAAEDTIRLSKGVFKALATGQLSAAAFKEVSAGKVDADDRILYSKATGALSYDADGSGKAFAAVQFAVLDNKAALTFQDILIG